MWVKHGHTKSMLRRYTKIILLAVIPIIFISHRFGGEMVLKTLFFKKLKNYIVNTECAGKGLMILSISQFICILIFRYSYHIFKHHSSATLNKCVSFTALTTSS